MFSRYLPEPLYENLPRLHLGAAALVALLPLAPVRWVAVAALTLAAFLTCWRRRRYRRHLQRHGAVAARPAVPPRAGGDGERAVRSPPPTGRRAVGAGAQPRPSSQRACEAAAPPASRSAPGRHGGGARSPVAARGGRPPIARRRGDYWILVVE